MNESNIETIVSKCKFAENAQLLLANNLLDAYILEKNYSGIQEVYKWHTALVTEKIEKNTRTIKCLSCSFTKKCPFYNGEDGGNEFLTCPRNKFSKKGVDYVLTNSKAKNICRIYLN